MRLLVLPPTSVAEYVMVKTPVALNGILDITTFCGFRMTAVTVSPPLEVAPKSV